MQSERRKNRSSSPGLAAQLYLEALAARCRLTDVVLSDEGGLLVAGTSNRGAADTLAAMAPFLAEGVCIGQIDFLAEATGGAQAHVIELSIGPARCFLVALGGRADAAAAGQALDRIFAN